MNTTLAIILTIVVTNWTSIGNFTDTRGRYFDVQEGQIVTNTVADLPWNEAKEKFHTNRFVLKSIPGPVIAERKVILITNMVMNIWATNIPWITNLHPFWNPPSTNRFYYNTNSNVIDTDVSTKQTKP